HRGCCHWRGIHRRCGTGRDPVLALTAPVDLPAPRRFTLHRVVCDGQCGMTGLRGKGNGCNDTA
ncbi:MAG: hypothetical protein ACK446_08790, partial [Rhodobacterales bacterium]